MNIKEYNILITAVSGTNTGTQIFHATKMIKNVNIIVTDISEDSYGKYISKKFYKVPTAYENNYIDRLKEICTKENINIIIPGSEPELSVLSENRAIFDKLEIKLLINLREVIDICSNKIKTVEFLKQNNFLYPKSITLKINDSKYIINIISKELSFPIVIKPYLNSGGSKDIFIIQDNDELKSILQMIRFLKIDHLMAQEYIGTHEEEYTIGVMSDMNCKAFSSFALKRLINSTLTQKICVKNKYRDKINSENLVISTGISQGYVEEFNEARAFAESIANKLGSSGPLNIQCRKTEKGFVVFEINPRFSGTTSMRAMCNHNDVELILRSFVEKKEMSQVKFKKGLFLRTLENNFIEDLK